MKILISLFDHSGNASQPFLENDWTVFKVDIKSGIDIMNWNYKKIDLKNISEIGIIAMIPCTAYALCGNRHKNTPERKIIFNESQKLVAKTKEIIDYFKATGKLKFWQVENPMTDKKVRREK